MKISPVNLFSGKTDIFQGPEICFEKIVLVRKFYSFPQLEKASSFCRQHDPANQGTCIVVLPWYHGAITHQKESKSQVLLSSVWNIFYKTSSSFPAYFYHLKVTPRYVKMNYGGHRYTPVKVQYYKRIQDPRHKKTSLSTFTWK